ncbi:hypothetical protein ONJ23_26090, partial [Salmonella enterica subsp. enterica serovar Virginia]|nr:hypothetical protein [Salmonella enterica subsp. enterica serovar Virginia]
ASMINRFETERPSLPAIALNTDNVVLTAIANDRLHDEVYAKHPQAGVAVLLTREYSYSRGEVDKQYIEPGVIGEPVPFTTSPAN